MDKLEAIICDLEKLAGRHSKRYGDKPVSNAQILQKFKILLKSIAELTSLPNDAFSEFSDVKHELDSIHQRLYELFNTMSGE